MCTYVQVALFCDTVITIQGIKNNGVTPLVIPEGEAGPLILQPSVAFVAIETTTGERLEPQMDSTQVGGWAGR